MGTSGKRSFSQASFYSLPGNGASDVPPSVVNAGEEPWTPATAAGIRADTTTGPTIILWPENTDASITHVGLEASGGGANVPVRTVTPETSAPAPPPTFPSVATVGAYTYASFVVPVTPLRSLTTYTLAVEWQDATGIQYRQTVRFRTLTVAQAEEAANTFNDCSPTDCAHGSLAFRTTDHKVVITGTPAVGQRLVVEIEAGGYAVCVLTTRPCPRGATKHIYAFRVVHTVRLRTGTVTIPLPTRVKGGGLIIVASLPRFTALGYQWQVNPLAKSQK